jgi:hypothetical protein
MNQDEVINHLKETIQKLEQELQETKDHLKKYTAPARTKTYYDNHKEDILNKNKNYQISPEKKKQYARQAYLNKKEKLKTKNENI